MAENNDQELNQDIIDAELEDKYDKKAEDKDLIKTYLEEKKIQEEEKNTKILKRNHS